MKYKLVCEDIPEKFDSEVNHLLSSGWELYGSPFAGPYSNDYGHSYHYCQALTKYKKAID